MSTFHYLPDGGVDIEFKAAKFNSPKINALAGKLLATRKNMIENKEDKKYERLLQRQTQGIKIQKHTGK